MDLNQIIVAFPWDDVDRRAYRMISEIPTAVPGSAPMPCADCTMPLAVGPLVRSALDADPALVLLCLMCAGRRCNPNAGIVVRRLD